MKEKILDSVGRIDDDMIERVDALRQTRKKRSKWIGWAAAAACLCVVIAAAAVFARPGGTDTNRVQTWTPSYTPAQYFRFSDGGGMSAEYSIAELPYAESRSFSDERAQLEADGVIPVIDTHPLFTAQAHYNSDGSLYSVELTWQRRDAKGLEHYSDLSVTAGYEPVPLIEDCIAIAVDDDGNVIEPGVTVTERDGVRITAVGGEHLNKTITFQSDAGWYQITGSWNDDFEPIVELLDWFWAHPLDFSRFPITGGVNYTYSTIPEMPDAFAAYLPDFQGFLHEWSSIRLKDGEPEHLETVYVSNATEEQIRNGTYRVGINGCTTVHWCIDTVADAYEQAQCIGDLADLTQDQVLALQPPDDATTQTKMKFMQNGCVVTVYASDMQQAWALIASIQ